MSRNSTKLKVGHRHIFKPVILLLVFLLSSIFISSSSFIVNADPRPQHDDDVPAKQNEADRSAIESGGSISRALAACDPSDGPDCLVNTCLGFSTLQYQDACLKKVFGLANCNPNSSNETYMVCVLTNADKCIKKETSVGIVTIPASQKSYCMRALAWYISGHHLQNPATVEHRRAYSERSPLLQGGTLNDDGSITPPGGGDPVTPTNPGSDDSGASGEDLGTEQLTDAQLEEEANELRRKLSKGENNCGDDDSTTKHVEEGSTVFDFNCAETGNPLLDMLFTLIKFVTFGIGLLIMLSIVISGFQFMTAQGNSQTTGKALKRIWNAVIALLLYIFGFALLNYLIPGGIVG